MDHQTANADNQKLRGGYYTPPAIAAFLAAWAVRTPHDRVLEPSCGDGALLEAAAKRLRALGASPAAIGHQVQGVELYASEAAAARARLDALSIPTNGAVRVGDFFQTVAPTGQLHLLESAPASVPAVEVVIGNPPFLRYQTFPEEQRQRAFDLMRAVGLRPTRLTNAWAAFLVVAAVQLQARGRLAMVIPAELLQVKYAEETRDFLGRFFGTITLITFKKLVFEGIQQEVVLLLAERTPTGHGIEVIECEDADDLAALHTRLLWPHPLKTLEPGQEKWTLYFLEQTEIDLLRHLRTHPALPRFGDFASVDVGIVTGNNAFFVVPASTCQQYGLEAHTTPLVGRTAQLPGLRFTPAEWEAQANADGRSHLLTLPPHAEDAFPAEVRAYLEEGIRKGVPEGYKCRIRKPWYVVPGCWRPDAFLFRQIHRYPKLVVNETAATCTDTIHRVRFHQPVVPDVFAGAFLNSLTFAFYEAMGRSYGGGVLEIEPNEAEHVPLPYFQGMDLDMAAMDAWERAGHVEALLAYTDRHVLADRLGVDASDRARLRAIWRKLSARRIERRLKKTASSPLNV